MNKTPFSHLFGINHAASPSETNEILQFLIQPYENLYHLDSEISRLEAALFSLKQERNAVQQLIDAHKALLSPARRLPPDILSQIFVRCLPEDRNATRSLTDAPLSLGRVCRLWRQVASVTPHLWTSIHIALPENVDIHYLCGAVDNWRNGVEAWLSKSGALPLSISFYASASGDVWSLMNGGQPLVALDDAVQRLFDSITIHLRRWEKIELAANARFLRSFKASLESNCPGWRDEQLLGLHTYRLTRITANAHGDSGINTIGFFCGFQAPNIHDIKCFNIRSLPQHIGSFGTGLSRLEFRPSDTNLKVHEAMGVFSRFNSLQFCSFAVEIKDSGVQYLGLDYYIHLPFLHTLRLFMRLKTHVQLDNIFFHHLSTPVLRSLKIEWEGLSWDHAPYLSLFTLNNQIEEFDVHSWHLTLDGLVECLGLLPNLTKLSIRNDPKTNSIIHALTLPAQSTLLCPLLKQLHIYDPTKPNYQNVMDYVRARFGTGASTLHLGDCVLKILPKNPEVYGRPAAPRSIWSLEKELDEYRRRGMQIDFGYSSVNDSPFLGQ
ncbi:hypothetical protein VKT23_001504 [Stygiomarasmius scandens]|uniref:F-box domain-containing protein n=1 Tax=Marasmiellus scandens TaxID=2682957 RepID=A0ABR1JZ20_9AGAR